MKLDQIFMAEWLCFHFLRLFLLFSSIVVVPRVGSRAYVSESVGNMPLIHLLILALYICLCVLCVLFVFAHLSYSLPFYFFLLILFISYLPE